MRILIMLDGSERCGKRTKSRDGNDIYRVTASRSLEEDQRRDRRVMMTIMVRNIERAAASPCCIRTMNVQPNHAV